MVNDHILSLRVAQRAVKRWRATVLARRRQRGGSNSHNGKDVGVDGPDERRDLETPSEARLHVGPNDVVPFNRPLLPAAKLVSRRSSLCPSS